MMHAIEVRLRYSPHGMRPRTHFAWTFSPNETARVFVTSHEFETIKGDPNLIVGEIEGEEAAAFVGAEIARLQELIVQRKREIADTKARIDALSAIAKH